MTSQRTTIIKALVSIFLLALIFSRLNTADMWQALLAADRQYILLAALFSLPILLVKSLKWWQLIRCVEPIPPLQTGLSLVAGMGVGLITPGRVGELARVSYLPVASKARFVGLVAIDRLLDLLAIMITGAIAIGLSISRQAALLLALPILLGLVLLFTPDALRRLTEWVRAIPRMPAKRHIAKVEEGLSLVNGRVLSPVFTLAFLTLFLGVFQFHLLLSSFGATPPLATAVSFPVLTIAGVIPITISGFGTREGAAVLILSQYNISEAVALNATLLSFILNSLLPGIFGLIAGPLINTSPQSS